MHVQENQSLITANASNSLAYHQLQGATQSQFIIILDPQISQILEANIPHQLFIPHNISTLGNNQAAQLYDMLAALFALYIEFINNTGADHYLQQNQIDQQEQQNGDFYNNIIIHT